MAPRSMLSRVSSVLISVGLAAALSSSCSNASSDVAVPTQPIPSPPADVAPTTPALADAASPTIDADVDPHIPSPSADAPAIAEALELTFVGDVIFGRYRPTGYDPIPENGHPVFAAMLDALQSDVLVGNLETPLVRELPEKSPIGSRFQFGASREHAELLTEAGFAAVSLANNHWFDMRLDGVRQTPEILREIAVAPLGAAVEEGSPFRVESLTRRGWTLGFVSITTRTNAPLREGVPTIPYLTTKEIGDRIGPLLEAARAEHDLLVVLVHWGDEYADAPSLAQKQAAHALVDAGADLVIGHHPHVLQGIERRGEALVAYSLGNFLFENTNEIPRQTGVLRVRVRRTPRCLERVVFHPAYVKRTPVQHPTPALGFMGRKVKTRVRTLSEPLGTSWSEEGDDLVLDGLGCG